MTDRMEVRSHRVYRNGSAVPYRQTPNGGTALTPTGIIVHDTAGDLPGTGSISWLTDPDAKASAHFVVGFDGSLTQLQALNRQTWHAGQSQYKGRNGCNAFTIGIEIANPGAMVKYGEGYSNNSAKPEKGVKVPGTMDVRHASSPHHGPAFWLAYSAAQIATVTELCRAIKAAYKIEFISTHWEICLPKGRKVDTNPLFPLAELRAAVFGGAKPAAPAADAGADPVKPPPAPDTTAAKKTATVNTDELNMRVGSSASSEVIEVLKKGTKVTINDTAMNGTTSWTSVIANGRWGWVSSRYLTQS